MSFATTLIEGAARAIASSHPELSQLIDLAIKYEPQLEKLGPVIVAGAEEGGSAYAAAQKAAPELAKAIKNFVHSIPGTAASPSHAAQQLTTSTENMTRDLFSIGRMTPEEEKAWMDRASGPTGSQAGSA